VVGARELDVFLADKDAVAEELEEAARRRAGELGLEVVSVGIRDVILPGDMKDLMNKVTEAKKAAEANLIFRREETAAMRSQANTAKLLTDNPTLMRLRELEVLEKVASAGNLNVILGEKGPGRQGCQLVLTDNATGSRDWASGVLFCVSPWGGLSRTRSVSWGYF
jgi:regulator of protease activity HflC (stomatin/prohibitin superfamily)